MAPSFEIDDDREDAHGLARDMRPRYSYIQDATMPLSQVFPLKFGVSNEVFADMYPVISAVVAQVGRKYGIIHVPISDMLQRPKI